MRSGCGRADCKTAKHTSSPPSTVLDSFQNPSKLHPSINHCLQTHQTPLRGVRHVARLRFLATSGLRCLCLRNSTRSAGKRVQMRCSWWRQAPSAMNMSNAARDTHIMRHRSRTVRWAAINCQSSVRRPCMCASLPHRWPRAPSSHGRVRGRPNSARVDARGWTR